MAETEKFEKVFKDELVQVQERRNLLDPAKRAPEAKERRAAENAKRKAEENAKHEAKEQLSTDAIGMELVGLSLSGGGIRSASVAIGFMQGLAQLRLLRLFDYVSSVSGGGYAATWLATWIQRDEKGIINVEKQLAPARLSQAGSTRYEAGSTSPVASTRVYDREPGPLFHVRSFANYLTPFPGLWSLDSWTLLAIYLRNTLVNLMILLPMMAAFILGSRLLVWFYAQKTLPCIGLGHVPTETWLAISAVGLMILSLGLLLFQRSRLYAVASDPSALRREWGPNRVVPLILFPVVAGFVLSAWVFATAPGDPNGPIRAAAVKKLVEGYLPNLGLSVFQSLFRKISWAFWGNGTETRASRPLACWA